MKVLSNREIYVLLKLLKGKELEKGSIINIEIDKNFTLEEIKHIQEEISLAENKVPDEIFSIENTYKKILKSEIHIGYKVSIIDIEALTNYSLKYVKALAKNELSGLSERENLTALINEFYSTIKDVPNVDNYIIEDLKYMPVVLLTYLNDLVELKGITNNRYDWRSELQDNGKLCDGLSVSFASNNGVTEIKVVTAFKREKLLEYLQKLEASESDEITVEDSITLPFPTMTENSTGRKPKNKTPKKKKYHPIYHMKPQQWKIFMCMLKQVKESNPKYAILEISQKHFINNSIFENKNGQQDTAISRFNSDYNRIKNNSKNDIEDLLAPKIDDTRYYQYNVAKFVNFCHIINNNQYLSPEFHKFERFISQIVE